MTAPTKTYLWGHTAELRLARAKLGLTQFEMSSALGMKKRSWQMMETGEQAVPSTLFADIEKLFATHEREVAELKDWFTFDPENRVFDFPAGIDNWRRSVVAAAARDVPLQVDCADDRDARDLQASGELS
ncbi:helix-turn-helix DNA-binding domain protein [Gordonia phage Skog]|uniref:Helix-turn-helix DNA-binding domain protein n=1 Tax=Gordonia phage Skog TaxID=2704033 RepID=A0A6G6XJ96_9CAUD|nr:helix-turn-helix DNA binding domain protein [Gordonia phage Skog]QIG58168.1 helix-turn-helix DNA-binding domain protein [Gordonia phage Skog]